MLYLQLAVAQRFNSCSRNLAFDSFTHIINKKQKWTIDIQHLHKTFQKKCTNQVAVGEMNERSEMYFLNSFHSSLESFFIACLCDELSSEINEFWWACWWMTLNYSWSGVWTESQRLTNSSDFGCTFCLFSKQFHLICQLFGFKCQHNNSLSELNNILSIFMESLLRQFGNFA